MRVSIASGNLRVTTTNGFDFGIGVPVFGGGAPARASTLENNSGDHGDHPVGKDDVNQAQRTVPRRLG
jgi:hypothetical protein